MEPATTRRHALELLWPPLSLGRNHMGKTSRHSGRDIHLLECWKPNTYKRYTGAHPEHIFSVPAASKPLLPPGSPGPGPLYRPPQTLQIPPASRSPVGGMLE